MVFTYYFQKNLALLSLCRLQSLRPIQPRIVPMGPHISNLSENKNILTNSVRRLEVSATRVEVRKMDFFLSDLESLSYGSSNGAKTGLRDIKYAHKLTRWQSFSNCTLQSSFVQVLRNCVNCIFENKISDARKTFPAVLRALQSKQARLALCSELAQHVSGTNTKAMLEHQQFDLVVRLMNCALQDDSSMDEYGVAAALLPLATTFCRKLCTGIIQFAYTCIQVSFTGCF